MKLFLGFLLAVFTGAAQTNVAPPLPNHWIGLGIGYNASGSPHTTGLISLALCINQTNQIYSYSTYEALPSKKGVPTLSTRTGLATVLRQFGPVYLLGLGTVGVAQTGTAVTSSFSGGGILMQRFHTDYTLGFGARFAKAGNFSQPIYEILFGRTW